MVGMSFSSESQTSHDSTSLDTQFEHANLLARSLARLSALHCTSPSFQKKAGRSTQPQKPTIPQRHSSYRSSPSEPINSLSYPPAVKGTKKNTSNI